MPTRHARPMTHTADSERAADEWLTQLERIHQLERVTMSEAGGGKVAVTAYLVDPDAPATERVQRELAVPVTNPDADPDPFDEGVDVERVEEALEQWEDELQREHGAVDDLDWRVSDRPGVVVATATVPAQRASTPDTPADAATDTATDAAAGPAAAEPAPRAWVCGECRTDLPPRSGPGRRRRYCSDACRSRASRARRPPALRCELRAGGWPCDQPAAYVVREPDASHRSGWSPHGLAVAACELCAELVEEFAARQPGVVLVGRQPVADYHAARLAARQRGPVW